MDDGRIDNVMDDEQALRRFIGREQELELFKEWLRNPDLQAPWILYFYDKLEAKEDKGGVGKTWLLRECASEASKLYPDITIVRIDFFNIADREGAVIADRVVEALKIAHPTWHPEAFDDAIKEYRKAIQESKEDATEIRVRLADALTAALYELGQKLSENLSEKRPYLLLLLDTYEMIEANPEVAVLRLAQAFPDVYAFEYAKVIIAGRNPLDWNQINWRGREYEVQAVSVAPFTPEEMTRYLQELSFRTIPINGAQIERLHTLTKGRPILVGLVTDVLKRRIMTLDDLLAIPEEVFQASLVAQINQLEHPVDVIVMFMSHLYHRFNLDLLDWIVRESHFTDLLQGMQTEEIIAQLSSLSFVRRASSGNDFVLHDEMRPLVNRYCWTTQDPENHTRRELSNCAVHYYVREIATTRMEQLRQAYTVELLYHKLFLDLNDGYEFFKRNFSQAANLLLSAFARSLLQETRQFAARMTPEQQYDLQFAEARLLQKEENAEKALDLFEKLEKEADVQWLDAHKADMLFEKGVCHRQLSNFPEAITYFSQAKDLYWQQERMASYGFLLNWLGSVYQFQGQLDTALNIYQECLDLQKLLGNGRVYANTLTSISNVYRLQGKIEEALRKSKIAWRLREEFFKQRKTSEVYVGWSRASIGAIYLQIDDLVEAERIFHETYDIFARIGHKKGIATMYNRFGQIALAKGQYKEAQEQFEKAYYTALGTDTASQITSLNKRGKIALFQQQWETAIDLLNQALELNEKAHDEYQRTESLIDLATVYEYTGHHEQAQKAFAEARNICEKYNYHYLLGLMHESQGEIAYQQSRYHDAFQDFAESCHEMALYNTLTYNKMVRKVIDTLLGVPALEIVPIADFLITYWIEHGLDQKYQDFVDSCEEVKALMAVQYENEMQRFFKGS